MKKLLCVAQVFRKDHYGRDVFLIPYYMGQQTGAEVTLAFPSANSTDIQAFAGVRRGGVKIEPVPVSKPIDNIGDVRWQMMRYVAKHAREYDTLLMYHLSRNTMVLGRIYKHFNPQGRLLVKTDGAFWVERMRHYEKPFDMGYDYPYPLQRQLAIVKRQLWRWCFQQLLREIAILAVEDRQCYERLLREPLIGVDLSKRVRYMLNGVDTEQMKELGVTVSDVAQRGKNFLTVGWVGNGAKNTTMILRACEKIDFKGWKIYIVGDLENKEYQAVIDDFFVRNPHLKETVIFTGGIYDKQRLWQMYNDCRVYIMSSRFESFNLSMLDGYHFHQYMLATEVGFTADMFAMGAAGETIGQDDADDLATKMQAICNGETDVVGEVEKTKYRDVSWGTMVTALRADVSASR